MKQSLPRSHSLSGLLALTLAACAAPGDGGQCALDAPPAAQAEQPASASEPAAAPAASEATETAQVESGDWGEVSPLHMVGELHLAGQPTEEDLILGHLRGISTIINLRPSSEDFGFDEERVAGELGMTYIQLPVGSPDDLDAAFFDKLRALLRESDGQVLVHCKSANRVGAAWLPWRVLDQGVDLETATAEAKSIGMRSPALEQRARAYIAAH